MNENKPLDGRNILIFVGEDVEDLEYWYPRLRLQEAGAKVTAAGFYSEHTFKGKYGLPCKSECALGDVVADDFDGLVVPGGWMPDKLRREQSALKLVRDFDASGKMIATICHGGWMLASAGILEGVRITGSRGIKDDMVNAGAIWEEAPVVIDRHFISSRTPPDLPAFGAAMVAHMSQAAAAS